MMNKKLLRVGVIGGMGPLASASFVQTIYTSYLQNESLKDQFHPPYVYLYSEPLLTQSSSIMAVNQIEEELLNKLTTNIDKLIQQEIDCIIICCFTAHVLLARLFSQHQAKIYSLVTLVLYQVLAHKNLSVVLCASSAREARVLETHPLWIKAAQYIAFVDTEIQQRLNGIINAVKNNQINEEVMDDFLELTSHYSNHHFIIACAELHILHKQLKTYAPNQLNRLFDPFLHITQTIWSK